MKMHKFCTRTVCDFSLVREKVEKNEFGDIKEIIVILQKDFTLSVNPNNRKGGLMGLAATAIALGKVSYWWGKEL